MSAPKQRKIRPKLVRIIARLNVGGPARQACLLHEKQMPFFEPYLIFGSLDQGEEDMSYLLSSESNVIRLPRMTRRIGPWNDFLAFLRILKFLRAERPDIVHTHTAKAGALGRLAAWLAGVQVIVHTYHGNVFAGYFNRVQTRIYLGLERLLGKLSTHIVAVSESQRRELCSKYRVVPARKASVINNGFELCEQPPPGLREDARKSLGLTAGDLVAVWAGRMVPIKNVRLLGKVIRMTWEQRKPIHFLVVGEGPESQVLKSILGESRNVHLLGWKRDMRHIWAAADAAILTSHNEGTPTVLIEAMAAGLPFVATNVGGVQDLAVGPLKALPKSMGHQAANGFLTEETPEALLYGIDQIAADLKLAREMGAAGRKFAMERFSADRLVRDLNDLYAALLDARPRAIGAS